MFKQSSETLKTIILDKISEKQKIKKLIEKVDAEKAGADEKKTEKALEKEGEEENQKVKIKKENKE